MAERATRPAPMTTADLVGLAVALGARSVPGWTTAEEGLASCLPMQRPLFSPDATEAKAAIERGHDPLGDSFCQLYSNEERRPKGATYTPMPIVNAMLAWAGDNSDPIRVVDPGAGSARFLVAAGRRFPNAELVAVELDPLAAMLARGHLASAGMAGRSRVVLRDYREIELPKIDGQTLFLGNPPYVRHHLVGVHWKTWLTETARRYGHEASQLAGLHVHFFLATAEHAQTGDVGLLITASEWLDVNYGRLVRELLMGVLGASNIQVIEPTATPFPGTQTTAAITGFHVGSRPESVGLNRIDTIENLGALTPGRFIRRERLEVEDRWSPLTRANVERREGFVELGELCRVHRGQVTGANRVWIAGENSRQLPESVLFPTVTRARELFASIGPLQDSSFLKRVIDLPVDLDILEADDRRAVNRFLNYAKRHGADSGFIASHRRAWWSVGLRQPAPILATYMARRPPIFVQNLAGARHINIAHGLYPRLELDRNQLGALAAFLSKSVSLHEGRTYAGGLTKFEPREMERLLVPRPERLADLAFQLEYA